MKSRLLSWFVVSVVAAFLAPAANADPITVQATPIPGTPVPCGKGGRVFESAQRNAFFTVYATDSQNNTIKPFVAQVFGNNVFVPIPGIHNGVVVCDAKNITNLQRFVTLDVPDDGDVITAVLGEESQLDIESLVLNPDGTLTLESVFGRLALERGFAPLRIPDLFSPTMDVLYSFVDIREFMLTEPSFAFGDVFNILNGETPALPGMLFSSTPFGFDSVTGPTFTPYTGIGEVVAFHEVSAEVPEPATLALTAMGLVTLGSAARRRRRRRPTV